MGPEWPRLSCAPPVRVHRRNLIAEVVHQCLDLASIVLLEPPNLHNASLQPLLCPFDVASGHEATPNR
jgi:hypothetical protein